MQAAIVCSKLVSYTLLPMLLLVVANGMRKDMLVVFVLRKSAATAYALRL